MYRLRVGGSGTDKLEWSKQDLLGSFEPTGGQHTDWIWEWHRMAKLTFCGRDKGDHIGSRDCIADLCQMTERGFSWQRKIPTVPCMSVDRSVNLSARAAHWIGAVQHG